MGRRKNRSDDAALASGSYTSAPVGDIPNRYTSDVVLNQQARVAHQGWYGGFAIPGGPVVDVDTSVLDAGAYGGSGDRTMAGYWRRAYGGSG
jgi:hypothetical protein